MKYEKFDPVKYRNLVNLFRSEWVEKTKNLSIQFLDTAQNFSIWLDKNGFVIKKENVKSATKEIVNVLSRYFGYDYDEMIKELEKNLEVVKSFKKYDENPEKYKGKCPKEI